MPVIACKLGFTQQVVGGVTYSFNFDERFGAHVAHVHNLTHAACFLSVEHYQEAVRASEQGMKQEAVRAQAEPEPATLARQDRPRKNRIRPVVGQEAWSGKATTGNIKEGLSASEQGMNQEAEG